MLHGYTHNQDDKARLINDNLDVVKKIAFYYVGRVGKVVEVDDLLQLGMVGLVEAAHNYTPKEDVTFVSYSKDSFEESLTGSSSRYLNFKIHTSFFQSAIIACGI